MLIKKVREFKFRDWLIENKIQLIVLIALTIIAYASTFDNEFLSDDIPVILNNPQLDSFSYVTDRFPQLVRPTFYYFINQIFGRVPAPYHVLNLLFHLGTVLSFYLLIFLLHNQQIAFIASLLAGIHPIMTEAVTWISGGSYSTYSFFVVLSLTFFILGYKSKKFRWMSLVSFCLGLAVSAKAMSYPFILTSLIILRPDLNFKFEWKKIILAWLIGLVGIAYTATLIPHRLQSLREDYYQNPQMMNPVRQVPTAVTKYLELIVWPKKLTLYQTEINLISQEEVVQRGIVFGLFSAIAIYTLFKNKKLFFWFIFSAFAIGPMLTPFGVSWLVAERYVYLSALGIFVLFGWAVDKLSKIEKIQNIPLIIFLTIVVPTLTLRTIVRNNVWQNQDRLWLAAAKYSPHSAQNQNNLGDLYARHGDFEKSIFHFQRAVEIRPNYADAYHNMANIYWRIGQVDKAIELYKKAEEFNPRIWQTHQNLGILYFQSGKTEEALDHMNQAIELNPNSEQLYANLAKMYAKIGDQEKAAEAAATSQQLSAP